jgi:transcriptional regulator with XRE-family HTH domain
MKGLGFRIKSLRKQRNITLVEVAKRTGIDQATLSRIENGKMTGTLDSHMKIADVLGIRLPDLYDDVLAKINEVKDKLTKQKVETFSHSSGAVAELLTSSILQKKMMPILLKIKPKGHTEIEEYAAATERFIYILKGSIQVTVGQESKLLRSSESFYFNASQPHHFKNAVGSESWALSIMTPASL